MPGDPMSMSERETESEPTATGMLIVRYGIGGVLVAAGIVMLIISPGGLGVDGFALAAGGGLSVLLLNALYRLSVSSELDREREEQARAYLEVHGEWPEDQPIQRSRRWALPAGVVTFEQERDQRNADAASSDRATRAAQHESTAC